MNFNKLGQSTVLVLHVKNRHPSPPAYRLIVSVLQIPLPHAPSKYVSKILVVMLCFLYYNDLFSILLDHIKFHHNCRDNPVYPAYKLAALRTLLFTRLLRGRFWAKKSAREKQNLPVKIFIFLGVKKFFWAWRKSKICPWKPITHVKKVKKPEKHARENLILPVKKTKNREKKAFTPTFFFTPKKKKHCLSLHVFLR